MIHSFSINKTTMRTFTLCIALFGLTFNALTAQWNRGADVPQEVLEQYEALNFDGMPYRFLLPEGYTPSERYPLLVSMHGGSGVGDDNESQILHWTANFVNDTWRSDFKCVIICPQSANGWHKPTADKDTVFALIDNICQNYSIDENRIYTIGHSGGAFGIWQMLAMNPDRFAGAICSAGGTDTQDCSLYKDVPIWNFHGDADKTIPVSYSRAIFEEMVRIGGNLKYSEIPGKGHGLSWTSFALEGTKNDGPYPTQFASAQVDRTTSRQWDWLFSQSKTGGEGNEEIAALNETLRGINDRFKKVDVRLIEWPAALQENFGELKRIAFMATPVKRPAGKLPLLVSLHGGGGKTMSLQKQLDRSAKVKGLGLAERAGRDLILLEPNSAGDWNADTLNAMLDYVLETHPEIDANRIYVMGHSMGGRGTWTWINESADRFAAASPNGSGIGDSGNAQALVRLPIWGMVGGADKPETIAGIKRMVERLREAGNKQVKYTEFPDANHAAANAAVFSSVELVDWMLGFSKGK